MKPAPFDYVRPESLAEACSILAAEEGAQLIAGGQTLVPMLAMRLSRPSVLVDILRLPELKGIRHEGSHLVIGATTPQALAERDERVGRLAPLLAAALPWVGHPPTRARGTVGGSVANADPSAEIALVVATLEAEIVVQDEAGATAMHPDEFFLGAMLTALPPGGCLSRIRFPIWSAGHVGVGFHEVSARKSDFALVSAAAQVALDDDGICIAAALGIGGVEDCPRRIAMDELIGQRLDAACIADVVAAATARLDAMGDLHASPTYRRRVARVLAGRALQDAFTRASASAGRSLQ